MSKQSVNIGTTANDGTGSPLRTAFDFINDNTDEVYALLGNGTTLSITGDVTMSAGAVTIANDAVTGDKIADDVALAGSPTTTTQSAGDNSTKIATTAYADTAVANAIDAAPAALDTLNELAASLNDDADFAGTMTTSLAGKLSTANGAVGTSNLADSAVTTAKITDANVTTAKIADDAVTADKLANSINTEIAANTAKTGITSGQASAITANTAKVTNATHTGDVTGATALTISNNAVTTAKIAADAVDGTKIADDSIDSEHYVDGSIDTAHLADDQITHDKIEARYTAQASITTLTGTVSFDCSTASSFKLSGNLTGAYTIDLSNYKKGQVITIWPLQAQSITLDAQGSSTNTFYKIGSDYDNTVSSIMQIECVDDSSTDPVFFYSIATFASDSTP